MTPFRLILRNLFHFRAASLAVAAGMAVATAVLAGALMVGDSVKGSLAALAEQRLGKTDYALVGVRMFQDSLASRVRGAKGGDARYEVAPALIMNGGASAGSGDAKRRAGDVQILATGVSSSGAEWVTVDPGSSFLNGELAGALGVNGGPVIFTFPSLDEGARDAVVARRDRQDAVKGLRVESSRVEVGPGMVSLFNLAGGQRVPRNAWLNLTELQAAVGQKGRANTLLVNDTSARAAKLGKSGPDMKEANAAVAELNRRVREAVELGDYGLDVKKAGEGEAALTSLSTYLEPTVLAAAMKAAADVGAKPRLVAVNLVNAAVKLGSDGKAEAALHYAIAAGISALEDGPLKDDEIAFNDPTATQLGVRVGDAIRLDYYKRQGNGELAEVKSSDAGLTFHVARILPMTGLAADRTLTPTYKGMTDANSVSKWDVPRELKIDMKLAEKDNEQYWDRYNAAPRLFISLDAARKLWGGAYGDVTSLRIPADKADAFAAKLRDGIDPASMGLSFRAVKAQQVAAAGAGGAEEFGWIFIGLSFFLIAAAALLVAMLFRLNIEQRARQIGLMAAVGFGPGKLRRLALLEGMILALIGGVVGSAGAVGYTWLMIYGLRTWWVGAVGTSALRLYVDPLTLTYGLVAGIFIAFCAVLWGVWRVGRTPPARLLAGAWNAETPAKARTGRLTRSLGVILIAAGVATLALIYARVIKEPTYALAGGAVLLAGSLSWLASSLRPHRHQTSAASLSSVTRLGFRNASRHTARSVLSVGLIAFAVFTLVIVAAMRQAGPGDSGDPKSGAGGYQLFVRAAVPLMGDPNTAEGREQLGVRNPANPLWSESHFLSMRRWAGEDVSCLNLTRPASPTILAVPHELVVQNRFSFASGKPGENPWALLEQPAGDRGDEIPVIADDQTAQYILQLPLGKTMSVADQAGVQRKLRLVATLKDSIFQSELLMGEANFRSLFPSQSGFGVVLAQTDPKNVRPLEQLLNNELDDYAVSVDTTAARLASYQQVANTYLSTFQVLGSLGLMLGTIGLAVVLVRNVIERRPELALLSAIGFRPAARSWLVLSENAFLLVIGLGVGAACAILGVLPTVLSGRGGIAVGPLVATLASVLVIGFAASALAVRFSGLRTTPADLRSE